MTADQLPQPADGSAPGTGAAPTGKAPTTADLQAEVARTRAELGATLDALSTRLSPAYQANRLKDSTQQAATDAAAFLTGSGLPQDDARRARNAKALLVGAAAVAVTVAIAVARRVRR
ncbi:DUF3618 domain-containing protein [Xylanimonas ulmi]|uniref:Uncharacterized protein DUF3618 n=1 Tax=Xylanimonas ulmi TaxID=228973 RepID=A0A4Q7M845_9MICO|nr:DUF3618 domain-containing protein [Xylanibacterium ulmi]RZS62309.1 uncharacterized protein DUF3618 [Xylanibacterium ulmi]